jgi:hypothetical protein
MKKLVIFGVALSVVGLIALGIGHPVVAAVLIIAAVALFLGAVLTRKNSRPSQVIQAPYEFRGMGPGLEDDAEWGKRTYTGPSLEDEMRQYRQDEANKKYLREN